MIAEVGREREGERAREREKREREKREREKERERRENLPSDSGIRSGRGCRMPAGLLV